MLRWLAVLPAGFVFGTLIYLMLMYVPALLLGLGPNDTMAFSILGMVLLSVANIFSTYFGAVMAYAIAPHQKLKSAQGLIILFAISTAVNLWHAMTEKNEASSKDLWQYIFAVTAEVALVFLMPNFLNPAKVLKYIDFRFPDPASKFGLKILLAQALVTSLGTGIRLCQFTRPGYQLALPIAAFLLISVAVISGVAWHKLSVKFRFWAILFCVICLLQLPDLFQRIPASFS